MSISNTFVNKVDLIFTHTIDLNYYKKTTLTTGGNNPINIFLSLKTLIYVSKTMQIIANIINSHPTWEPQKKKSLEIIILNFLYIVVTNIRFPFFKQQIHVCIYYPDTLALVMALFSCKASCRSIPN